MNLEMEIFADYWVIALVFHVVFRLFLKGVWSKKKQSFIEPTFYHLSPKVHGMGILSCELLRKTILWRIENGLCLASAQRQII